MRKFSEQTNDAASIDLTPMLDVVFIMLIFFIVTASFVKEVGMPITVPPKPDGNPSDVVPTVFTVNSNSEISIDNRRVDIRSVRSIISQRVAVREPLIKSMHALVFRNFYPQGARSRRAGCPSMECNAAGENS